jgi:biotin carboxyl carrier protein
MFVDGVDCMYYLTLGNELYPMPAMAEGIEEGILRGIYRLSAPEADGRPRVRILGSGALLNMAVQAAEMLARDHGVAAEVFSVTSYQQLHRNALETDRWNRLHPAEPPRVPYVRTCLGDDPVPVVAVSDYVRALPASLARWLPGRSRPSAPTASAAARGVRRSARTSRWTPDTSRRPPCRRSPARDDSKRARSPTPSAGSASTRTVPIPCTSEEAPTVARDVKLPELGENIEEAEVISVLVQPGQSVTEGQALLELETDKATVEVPAPFGGVVSAVQVKPGDRIRVGQTIVALDAGGDGAGSERGTRAGACRGAAPRRQEGEARREGRTRPRRGAAGTRVRGGRVRTEPSDEAEPRTGPTGDAPVPARERPRRRARRGRSRGPKLARVSSASTSPPCVRREAAGVSRSTT